MDWKSVVDDVSSFLLIESSGDSDQIDDLNPFPHALGYNNITKANDDDEDDAESCNYNHEYLDHVELDKVDDDVEEDAAAADDDQDDNCVIGDCNKKIYKKIAGSQNIAMEYARAEQIKDSAVSNDSSTGEMMLMNEEEKNRLFWETCLTFGLQ